MVRHSLRVLTFGLGAVVAGSVLPDLDHILPPFQRSWGHTWIVPCLILFGLAIASISRLLAGQVHR